MTTIDRPALREMMAKVMDFEVLQGKLGPFYQTRDHTFGLYAVNWTPDTNPTQVLGPGMLVERMREKGWYLNLEAYRKEDGYVANFNTATVYPGPQASHDNPATAICLAIEAAMKDKTDE